MTIFSQAEIDSLSHGEIEIEGRLVDASNATLVGTISSDREGSFRVVYKPVAGERPLWDFPNGTLAAREVAAFHISRSLGFDCVPPTVLREGPFGPGAVQRWIDIDLSVDIIEIGQSHNPAIRKLALFDAVVNNTDRKFGHILPAMNGEIYGCDHGVTFHVDDKLRTVLWQFAGDELTEEERRALIELSSRIKEDDVLQDLLDDEEISALNVRIVRLLNDGHFPYPNEEWPAVPWPPV
jgi:uncharacterized repeat protein (TIGR03843 family)